MIPLRRSRSGPLWGGTLLSEQVLLLKPWPHTCTLSCPFTSLCWIFSQTSRWLRSMERGRRGAGQMAPSAVFSPFSAAAVVFSTTLISLCSQFGSHGRRERVQPLMRPSQRAEAGREAETDKWNRRRRGRLSRSSPLYRANLWL